MATLAEAVLQPGHSSASFATSAGFASFQRQVELATGRAYHISIGVSPELVEMRAELEASAGIVAPVAVEVWLCVAVVIDSLPA